jgi:2-(1,2-epoxy-1,2-dihydrophenyl)acetyl-CoA isomerase
MAYTDILYDVDNLIATITLNRPDKLNAWTSEMDREVRHAVERRPTAMCGRSC